ncbi:uncharacterized protein F4822DRAFT_170476 [Hypoxylon trugodes]|uniref:uncharacterized protein n=1 Tax=Hypoxylon trugodes TaxID=326681 RepID=UPI00219E72F2|nr:uncharacterized protein F4822DRAFT_170476 [Hypoxylon trugodes]KAI1391028.1 hypothetical protein F4822DRAFT_170476 [Hypoxylon trugodes]
MGDVETLLNKGYWPSSRARSPDSRHAASTAPSGQLTHRNVTSATKIPRNFRRSRSYPPPPSVEDEVASLAKEYKSADSELVNEEAIHRGDPDQYPILLEVHEFNPERRFVLVSNTSDSTDDSSDSAKRVPRRSKSRAPKPEREREPKPELEPEPDFYKANTGRKYDTRGRYEDDSEKKRDIEQGREKHRSKLDHLPAIVTDVKSDPRPSDSRRPKSTARSEKGGDDYFSPRHNSRFQNGNMLSPDVIEHASRGRDRAYYQGGSNPYAQDRTHSAHPNSQYEKYEKTSRDDRRYKDKPLKAAQSASPNHHKRRSTADLPQQARASSRVDYEKPRQYAEPRSPRPDRNVYVRSERDTASQVSSSSTEKRDPPAYGQYYSSDDEIPHQISSRRRRESALPDRSRPRPQTPTEVRSSDKRNSRAPSPLPSPRVSQIYEKNSRSSSPRSSTFPKDIRFSRSEQRAQQPPISRTSTGRSVLEAAPVILPAVVAAGTVAAIGSGHGSDRHKSAIPSPPRAESLHSEPRSSNSALSSSPRKHARQPSASSSVADMPKTSQLISMYNIRYLDEVQAGRLPEMHRCPRRQAVAGYVDWLTFPRCDNFNICPSCYEAAFSNTEFAHQLVPIPFRAADRAIACDFGTSRYYHIAYYLISKYKRADLSLFRNIANIAAKGQPCTGSRESIGIWYSVKDPRSMHAIESFTVCHTCAKTVEALLPNLTGLFVPMDSPAEPTRGVCAMHQQNERRFLFYFDLLEAASDKALITKSTPDVQALADRIRDLTAVPECTKDQPVHNGKFYTMLSIPKFTVCEECFGEVVWPMIENDSDSIAANFHKNPQKFTTASCQLYSERMREIFKWAVKHGDIRYLENKVRERQIKEQEYYASVVGLDRQILSPEWVDAELNRARREWQRWE